MALRAPVPATQHQQAGYRRFDPDAIELFAHDFAGFLRTLQSREIAPEQTKRLDVLLDEFNSLADEMRAASREINDLIGRPGQRLA